MLRSPAMVVVPSKNFKGLSGFTEPLPITKAVFDKKNYQLRVSLVSLNTPLL